MIDDFRPTEPLEPAPKALKPTPKPTDSDTPVPFETPEQVSAHDIATPEEAPSEPTATATIKPPRGSGHHWFNLPWPPNRAEIIATAVILLLGIGGGSFLLFHKQPKPQADVVVTKPVVKPVSKPVQPTTVASTLSGLPVTADTNSRPVIGAMIENSKDARPQSGLSQASVVFEAVAEGGITRFLALFQDQQPTNIGPVRSARPYYAQWLMGFKAAYAHVGGSPDALSDIKSWGIQDLNQFSNAAPYHRISSRPSPHNVYASVVDLANLATQKGYKSTFTGFVRKAAAPAKTPTASTINLNLSSSLYNVQYGYDAASNTYLRSEGGATQTDANTGKQLAPNVVVAMVVPLSAGNKDAQGSSYSNYNVIGSGQVDVFQDGTEITGTWTKTANDAQITFTGADGKPLALDPGQTWITAVTNSSSIIYR